jgi:excisionase family DNA binding protein
MNANKIAQLLFLRHLRHAGTLDHFTQQQLSDMLAVDQSTISRHLAALDDIEHHYLYLLVTLQPAWTVAQFAVHTGLSGQTVRGLIAGGVLRACQVAGAWRLPGAELDRWRAVQRLFEGAKDG